MKLDEFIKSQGKKLHITEPPPAGGICDLDGEKIIDRCPMCHQPETAKTAMHSPICYLLVGLLHRSGEMQEVLETRLGATFKRWNLSEDPFTQYIAAQRERAKDGT